MSLVTVVIATTTDVALGAGISFGQYDYSILAADGVTVVQEGKSAALTFAFPDDVPAGSYTAVAQALDSTGAKLGTSATAAFTVVAAPVTFAQPATLTVTVA
jgi:hypothetical protein